MTDVFTFFRSFFEQARTMQEAADQLPKIKLPSEGSASVQAIASLRGLLSMIVPSRMYADMIIVTLLVALTIVFGLSIVTNCRQLGCAMLRLVFCCTCLGLLVFWLYTVCRLSNEEFHNVYVDGFNWAAGALSKTVQQK